MSEREDVETLAATLADSFDEWLFRMHGVTSSCRHAQEGEGLADAVLASSWLAVHDELVRADERKRLAGEVSGDDQSRAAAWREGYEAGFFDYAKRSFNSNPPPNTPNPYGTP